MLTPDWWDETIANWAFGSNLAAELIGLALTFLFGTLVYRAWLKRQRAIPLGLIRKRLDRAAHAIVHEACGRLGVGYWWEYERWDERWALALLLQRLKSGETDPDDELAKISAGDWLEVAGTVVKEFSDLERSIALYSSVLASERDLFEAYSMLDDAAQALKDYVEHLGTPKRDALSPTAVRALEQQLIPAVSYAVEATACIYAITHGFGPPRRAARARSAWSKLSAAFRQATRRLRGKVEGDLT